MTSGLQRSSLGLPEILCLTSPRFCFVFVFCFKLRKQQLQTKILGFFKQRSQKKPWPKLARVPFTFYLLVQIKIKINTVLNFPDVNSIVGEYTCISCPVLHNVMFQWDEMPELRASSKAGWKRSSRHRDNYQDVIKSPQLPMETIN